MDRITIKRAIKKGFVLPWNCPACKRGVLTLKAADLRFEETRKSVSAHQLDEHMPEWVDYIFVAGVPLLDIAA